MGLFDRFKKQGDKKAEPPRAYTPPPEEPEPMEMEMPPVQEMPVETLKARLERGEKPLIVDVREGWEYQLVRLDEAVHIPMREIPKRMSEFDKQAEIVVHCHHGARSYDVAAFLMQNGFARVWNLTGGIDAWARRIDRSKRLY